MKPSTREQAITQCIVVQQEVQKLAHLLRNSVLGNFADALINDVAAIESALIPEQRTACPL